MIANVENKEPPKNINRLLQDKPTKLEYSAIKIRLNYRPGYYTYCWGALSPLHKGCILMAAAYSIPPGCEAAN